MSENRPIRNYPLYPVRPFLLFILLALLLANPLYARPKPKAPDPITATVIRVVDGDTLKVRTGARQEESIRLIGIDTPESKANKKARKDAERSNSDVKTITAMGKESAKFTETLVKPGDEVRIEFDVKPRDQYGRLLGYVYLSNGKMLNEEIIKAGYASVLTYPPNVKFQECFSQAYKKARDGKKGLWH